MSLLLAAAATIGLGVGAASSTEVIVKINGKDTVVKVAGAPAGNQQSKVFLQCLVAHRVLRVSGGNVTMLDKSNVATHLSEFAQSQTSADPCELGKAAYTAPPLPSPQQTAAAPATPEPAPTPAPKTGKSAKSKDKIKEPHVSFATSPAAELPPPIKTDTAAPQKPANAANAPATPTAPPTSTAPPNAPVAATSTSSPTSAQNTSTPQSTATPPQTSTYH